jgi:hypothetical protein
MPFDGTDLQSNELITTLESVTSLIKDQQWWCKGMLVNQRGQMCLRGAMRARRAESALAPVVLRAVADVTGRPFQTIERFNDDSRTTHAVVLQVLDRTREIIVASHWTAARPRLSLGARCRHAVRTCRRLAAGA